jgi:hypothetical protein
MTLYPHEALNRGVMSKDEYAYIEGVEVMEHTEHMEHLPILTMEKSWAF